MPCPAKQNKTARPAKGAPFCFCGQIQKPTSRQIFALIEDAYAG
ncbi:hypothetical protein P3T40_001897 [Paraburkholderia sp. EB58]|jgi:hypothetical protein